jgi:hypothetical protein
MTMNDTTHILGPRRRTTTRTWVFFGAGLAVVLVMLALIAVACQDSSRMEAGGAVDATPSSPGTGGLGAASGDQDGEDGSGQAGPPAPAPAPPAGEQDPGAQPDPTGPTIEYFQVLQQPQCPGGTNLNPIEGQPVALEWKVIGTDGDEVSLSIDGPGVYNTYPAEGSDVINFPCEGEEGDIQEHTYLLTAEGDGVTVTETLVVQAKVQQVTDVSMTQADA